MREGRGKVEVSGKELRVNKKANASGDNPVRSAASGKDYWELIRDRIKEAERGKSNDKSDNG